MSCTKKVKIFVFNGWQRLWVVLSVIILVISFFVALFHAPSEKNTVINDISNPSCEYLLKLPESFRLTSYPSLQHKCYYLSIFRFNNADKISSIKDYKNFIFKKQILNYIFSLIVGLFISAALYLSGWSFVWVFRGFKSTSN